ncbi:MAG: glycoside hydrolase, partial [Candidatus Latescibacterota bacterium]
MAKNHSNKTLYVIHHSHTDIGYTEMQGRIERWQVDFVRQALRIIESGRGPRDNDFTGFRWVCEAFWAVERFLEQAKPHEVESFIRAVKSGDVGLSASYLNFTELLDRYLLSQVTARAAAFGATIGVPVRCAMTADINGFGWGFSQALHDHGVENLFCCIHTHHGMYPLGRQQIPFWWETPRGNRILVWSGEHYHFGNELGIVPGAVSSYLTKDECDANMIFADHWGVASIRIPRYVERLEQEGYPYDFVPVMASGLRTDNAPPSDKIIEFIKRWNTQNGDRYRIQMTTLDDFFKRLRAQSDVLPVYRGDWPDWWADGAGSAPAATKMFRQAQRDLHYYMELKKRYPNLRSTDTTRAEYDLALYTEHTFGHSDAMGQPWHPLVHSVSARKKSFAVAGREKTQTAIDDALEQL